MKIIRMLLNDALHLRPETMAIKKGMRAVDLVLQLVFTLEQQLLDQLIPVFGLLQRPEQRQWIKGKPDLGGVAINFVNRPQKCCQGRGPSLFVVAGEELFKLSFSRHSLI